MDDRTARPAAMPSRPAPQPDMTDAPISDATDHEQVMTVTDAAEVLGVTADTVRKRIRRGQLAGQKIRGQWRVSLDATDLPEATGRDATPPRDRIREHDTAHAVDRLGELEREAGRLQAERDAAQRERDDLADRMAAARGLADQLEDLLQKEWDALIARLQALEAQGTEEERPTGWRRWFGGSKRT